MPPSAFIPLCSYQGNSSLLGQTRRELNDVKICDKFRPTILEGQLCFSLDIAKLGEKPTKSGKSNRLFLLLDPNPYQLKDVDEKNIQGSRTGGQSFKVFIHTLAQFTASGPGVFAMSTLKRMTGTKSFKELPDKQKQCFAHNREDCQTQKYLDQVHRGCNCTPWALGTDQGKDQVKNKLTIWLPFCRCSHSVAQKRKAVLQTKL